MADIPDRRSDEELYLQFMAQGDREALALLCARYQALAYRIAYGMCGQAHLAEEAVQEAFLQLARGTSRFESGGPDSFRSWFCVLTMNQVRNLFRVEQRAQERTRKARDKSGAAAVSAAPVSSTEKNETSRALENALGDLQEELRLPIVLHCVEGLTQAQVGEMMGVSQSLIARRVSEGLGLLRKRLEVAGIMLSASALPLLLKEGNLLCGSEQLTTALSEICRTAKLNSARMLSVASKKSTSLLPWVAAGVLAVCGALIFWPNTPVAPPVAAPIVQMAPATAPLTSWAWDFDRAPSAEFINRKDLMADAVRSTYTLPTWQDHGGKNNSGCLLFTKPGNSLIFKTGVPLSAAPLTFEFEMLIQREQYEFSIENVSKHSAKMKPSTAKPAEYQPHWKVGDWVRVTMERHIENGVVISQMYYDGNRYGNAYEIALSEIPPEADPQLYFEIYGYGFLIDQMKLKYDAPSTPASR